MKAEDRDLFGFLCGTQQLVIPVYQRNYDWKISNCKQLFYDIEKSAITHKKHFVGTICTKTGINRSSIIIDGQQRITSIMLLLKAMYHLTEDDDLQTDIENYLFSNARRKSYKIKLKPIKRDEDMYVRLMEQANYDESAFSKKDKESNIFKNYYCFRNLLKNSDVSIEDLLEATISLQVVELMVAEDENPQIIFEGINSTGLDLTNTDKMRNYLLMSLDYGIQEEMYSKYWMEMEEMIGTEQMEQFMLYYLIMKRKSDYITIDSKKSKINLNNLYEVFKMTYPINDNKVNASNVDILLADMFKYCEFYNTFISQTAYTKNKIEKRLYELFTQLDAKDSSIFLMPLYEKLKSKDEIEKIEENDFIAVLDAIISFQFRSKVCKRYGMNPQTSSLSLQKLDSMKTSALTLPEKVYEILTSYKGGYSFPKDSEFKNELIHKDLYKSLKSIGCRYLLGRIEQSKTKEFVDVSDASIEHIVPQDIKADWRKYLIQSGSLENYEVYLHTLGNLALTKYNSELSNNMFDSKKQLYETSNFIYTKKISQYNIFNEKTIYERAEELATCALEIWKLPEKYNTAANIRVGATYTLDTDFSNFISTKPDIVGICGEEYEILNWREMWIKFNETFYNLDKAQYKKIATIYWIKNKLPVCGETQSTHYDYELENGECYLNTNMSTYDILFYINEMVIEIDKINKTNFRDEIWITIRKINK